ncbi:MAG TPA: hypothetical protein OIM52_17650 [Fusicatenibacter saccharivorans]|nr:hypothetical protein [Fusicatenibacter saccharivorans]
MGRLNDIVNGDGELTNKETAEILKILLANYYLVRMWKINPDEGTIYTLAINKAIKALEHAENNETESVYDMAHEIGDPYYADSPMSVTGAKVVDEYLYIKGYDGGFPSLEGYLKVDLKTRKIVKEYGAWNSPVSIENGVYE